MSRIRRITPLGTGWLVVSMLLLAGSIPSAVALDADHLIITEVVTKTRTVSGQRLGSEFIEVVNPTAGAIDLSDVYLTDGTYAPNETYYWNIADGLPNSASTGGGRFNDFHVRFPDGYVLAAGDTVAISVFGSAQYFEAYGQLPDFELYEDNSAPDAVPEMVAVFPNSVHEGDPLGEVNAILLPSLSDNAESLILYTWDGETDLVADLDFMFWGAVTNVLFDKNGRTVGAGTYVADTDVSLQEPVTTASQTFGWAYARLSADEGTESLSGGNGLDGHDETSENLGTTWAHAAGQNPPSAPLIHFATAPIFLDASQNLSKPYEGQDVVLTAAVVSFTALTGVDFVYTVDGGGPVTLAGVVDPDDADVFTATVPSQVAGAVITWHVVANNSDGRDATWPAVAPTFSEGWTVDSPPDPGDFPAKLLITEVATIGTDQEFIEIANLGTETVDLSNYFLTDANYSPNNQYYYRIAEGNPGPSTIGGGVFNDFHSQFPTGFSIAAGDTIVVSVAGSKLFAGEFGFLPDLELFEDDPFPDNVHDMRWVFGDAINNSIVTTTGENTSLPTLTNGVETVILYHWDGVSDSVTDIDVFNWRGAGETSTSTLFSKTGVTVGGHSYLPDTAINLQTPFSEAALFGSSYQRNSASEGAQIPTGSNGVLGADETSEDLNNTFTLKPYDPSRPSNSGGGGGGTVKLIVEAKTFNPSLGERFPIRFVSERQSETKLRLFDLEGRLVIALFDSRFHGAASTIPEAPTIVVWDGKDSTFQPIHAGMYIAHLSVVNNATGKETTKTAPVVVATRLSN